jgi:hypothetical protein
MRLAPRLLALLVAAPMACANILDLPVPYLVAPTEGGPDADAAIGPGDATEGASEGGRDAQGAIDALAAHDAGVFAKSASGTITTLAAGATYLYWVTDNDTIERVPLATGGPLQAARTHPTDAAFRGTLSRWLVPDDVQDGLYYATTTTIRAIAHFGAPTETATNAIPRPLLTPTVAPGFVIDRPVAATRFVYVGFDPTVGMAVFGFDTGAGADETLYWVACAGYEGSGVTVVALGPEAAYTVSTGPGPHVLSHSGPVMNPNCAPGDVSDAAHDFALGQRLYFVRDETTDAGAAVSAISSFARDQTHTVGALDSDETRAHGLVLAGDWLYWSVSGAIRTCRVPDGCPPRDLVKVPEAPFVIVDGVLYYVVGGDTVWTVPIP